MLLKALVHTLSIVACSVENYEGDGVIFQGNVRGRDPAVSYAKMKERLKNRLSDKYQLFLLQDKDDKPTVIVLPDGAGSEKISRGQEIWLAIAFAIGTALTTVNAANVPVLQWLVDPYRTLITEEDWKEAVPFIVGTLVHLSELEHCMTSTAYTLCLHIHTFKIPSHEDDALQLVITSM